MAISYDAGTDTITVTEGTVDVPITFTDIYNADVAGAWGQVTQVGNMFVFDCKLVIGDASTSTYLADIFKKVTLNDTWTITDAATLKTGLLFAAEGDKPRKGCYLLLNTTEANAITVNNGGTYLMYQTLTEDIGAGTNLISGATESFYGGAMALDLLTSVTNVFGIGGRPENTAISRITESILAYYTYILRYNPLLAGWQTYNKNKPNPPYSAFNTMQPGLGYSVTPSASCCFIIDNLVDGSFYDGAIWAGVSNKYHFELPAGGGGLMRNPPMTGGMV